MSNEIPKQIFADSDKEKLRQILGVNLKLWCMTIFFEKKDGSLRTLKCTLSDKIIPQKLEEDSETPKKERKPNADVLSVWDLENDGWRSFRLDKVQGMRYDAFLG
jgi:hypothetical protein